LSNNSFSAVSTLADFDAQYGKLGGFWGRGAKNRRLLLAKDPKLTTQQTMRPFKIDK
jgi:hypothetical protein